MCGWQRVWDPHGRSRGRGRMGGESGGPVPVLRRVEPSVSSPNAETNACLRGAQPSLHPSPPLPGPGLQSPARPAQHTQGHTPRVSVSRVPGASRPLLAGEGRFPWGTSSTEAFEGDTGDDRGEGGDRWQVLTNTLSCAPWSPGRCFFSDDTAPGQPAATQRGSWPGTARGPLRDPPPASVRWAPHSPPSFLCLHL